MLIDKKNYEKFMTGLCFDDVLLVPQYSKIRSRSEIDIGSTLSDVGHLDVPILSSPMDTVTCSSMAEKMSNSGGMGIIHRYNTIDEQASHVMTARKNGAKNVGAATGITGDYIERAGELLRAGANVVCVDVAHGHHVMMKDALKALRDEFGSDVHIMAGNVATREGFDDLARWGASSVRTSVGGGSICSTRIKTAHGVPTFQSILDISESEFAGSVQIIADGGIKNSGDIVKALAAGADFVMLGSLLSGTLESPGEIIYKGDKTYKVYRGMASVEAQIDWRGHASSLEGVSTIVQVKGSVSNVLSELCAGIRSGLSYSGALNIDDLHSKARFICQTSSGAIESSAHIKLL
ncbi:guanosine monophosphate reductase [Candidatus Pacearchaeota archaeon]|nr:guanosine monophosphate reductase [Candidatus Pacearchaeota archaeon]|tara:strand:- start:336 stop:1385 length:1050 start_codon:yes stop_codon:yes gene_type:complete